MKTILNILPKEGLNEIKFEMDRSTIQKILGSPSDTFLKNTEAPNTTDEYKELGIFLYYDAQNKLIAIEAWNEALIFLDNFNLFESTYDAILKYLKQFDDQLDISSDMLISYHFNIAFWYENDISPDSFCDSVTVFQSGYL